MKQIALFGSALIMGIAAVVLMMATSPRSDTIQLLKTKKAAKSGQSLNDGYYVATEPRVLYPKSVRRRLVGPEDAQVLHQKLARAVGPDAPITWDMFSASATPGLSQEIGRGMRAITLDVDEARSNGYLLRPGDRVDVVFDHSSSLFQAKKILAVGRHFRSEDERYFGLRSFSSVTLEVTPEEAREIATHFWARVDFTLLLIPDHRNDDGRQSDNS